jgi:hypothetical protein
MYLQARTPRPHVSSWGRQPPSRHASPLPSSVPVTLGDNWFDKLAVQSLLGTPNAMTLTEIDEAIESWKREHELRGSRIQGYTITLCAWLLA